jgi:membrane associated rhomboid family serine protease
VFIPVRDINPTQSAPVVNYLLMGANILAWLWQLALQATGAAWVEPGYGVVPIRLTGDPPGEAFTIMTSMFMHGGWLHLGGNMLYLYIFGDNVEEAMGHVRYVAFYLACGVVAALAQVLVDPSSQIPMVGASGAIAGVLGAYLVLYPKAPIMVLNTVLPLWLFFGLFLMFPAWLAIGTWFIWNLLGGLRTLGAEGGGVAFFSHIGGFIAGLGLIQLCMRGRCRRVRQPWGGWRLPSDNRWSRRAQLPRRPRVDRASTHDEDDQHRDPWYPPDRYH